jgi:FkbM family methyltransferase
MYAVTQGTFRTPRGRSVTLNYREDTNDWNTLNACLTEDEYGLKDLHLSGVALDIGAYIGGVTIGLALDNPDLHVVAVEAVPPNVVLLRENLTRAGAADRVTVVEGAAGDGQPVMLNWGYSGNEAADHHSFIGNAVMAEADLRASHAAMVPTITLASLVADYGPFSFAKVDCEGCEYPFLSGSGLEGVALIRGEEHYGPLDLPGYDVTYTQGNAPRGFEAIRRG